MLQEVNEQTMEKDELDKTLLEKETAIRWVLAQRTEIRAAAEL